MTIITGIHWWHGHYDPNERRPKRCGGEVCRYCDSGRRRELRIVLGCADGNGQRWLLELRERHREFIEKLEGQREGIAGTVIDIWKRGEASNSPVEVDIVRHKLSDEWDIRLLVAELGLTT